MSEYNYMDQVIAQAEELCIKHGWTDSQGRADFDKALKELRGKPTNV